MLLEEHGEVLEADLRWRYGVRLTDLYRGGLSFRELDSLISQLPMESGFRTLMRDRVEEDGLTVEIDLDAPHGPWSKTEHLLAALIDAINVLINVQIQRAGVEAPPVEPVRRPGVKPTVPPVSPAVRAAGIAYLEDIRARNRGVS